MSAADEKGALRRAMRARRKALSPDEKARSAREICATILADAWSASAHREATLGEGGLATVAVYLASPDEIDLTEAIVGLLARGVRVVAPRWNGETYELAQLKSLREADVRVGPMKILEPAQADLVDPPDVTVWLVPGLAFTRAGGRLGYGGGWYDRLMAHASPHALKLAIAYSFQIVDTLPSESHDIPLDGIIMG